MIKKKRRSSKIIIESALSRSNEEEEEEAEEESQSKGVEVPVGRFSTLYLSPFRCVLLWRARVLEKKKIHGVAMADGPNDLTRLNYITTSFFYVLSLRLPFHSSLSLSLSLSVSVSPSLSLSLPSIPPLPFIFLFIVF